MSDLVSRLDAMARRRYFVSRVMGEFTLRRGVLDGCET